MMIKLTEKCSDDNVRDVDALPNTISSKKGTRTHWCRHHMTGNLIIMIREAVKERPRVARCFCSAESGNG